MAEEKKQVESEKIWNEIKNLPIDVFAIQNQVVSDHVTKVDLPGAELYIKLMSPAVLPALEATLSDPRLVKGNKYEITTGEGYVVIKRGVNPEADIKKALAGMKRKK